MRSVRIFFFMVVPLAVLMTVCRNVNDVGPTSRTTFIKVYEKGNNYAVQVAESISDGYILGSNLSLNLGTNAFISKTDMYGNILWETEIRSYSVTSIKLLSNSTGYLIFGDSIKTNPGASNINDRIVTRATIIIMDSDGKITSSKSLFNPLDATEDYHGTGINFDGDGNFVTVGNKKASSTSDYYQAYIAVYTPGLDTLWTHTYPLLDQDFVNANNVYTTSSGQIFWSNSVQKVTLSSTLSYLTLPVIDSASTTYSDNDFLGQSNPSGSRLVAQEMQAGFVGQGVIGTFGTFENSASKGGNLFFVRIADTKYQPNTILVLDGVNGIVASGAAAINNTQPSASEDAGLALCKTNDNGFVLGGTMKTTLARGNGGLDIWLTRIDGENKVVWNKVFGSVGDETVNSIRSLSDGTFLVAGGSSTNGLSAAILMRIDANGEIKN